MVTDGYRYLLMVDNGGFPALHHRQQSVTICSFQMRTDGYRNSPMISDGGYRCWLPWATIGNQGENPQCTGPNWRVALILHERALLLQVLLILHLPPEPHGLLSLLQNRPVQQPQLHSPFRLPQYKILEALTDVGKKCHLVSLGILTLKI